MESYTAAPRVGRVAEDKPPGDAAPTATGPGG